jgi:DNA-binding response OmpR family regulator
MVHEFDAIILDVMLPGLSGFEILRRLRKEGNETEVLLLTARSGIEDRVEGLDLGADDYLVKPFAFEELLARLRVLMRRRFGRIVDDLRLGNLRIDFAARRLFVVDKEVSLRPREFDIFEYLAQRSGKVVSRTQLVEHAYDHAKNLSSNAIDSAICTVRKHLAGAGADVTITTVPKRGYVLDPPK